MNDSDFEKRLQRQPLRAIPPEWRAEILRQANSASQPSTLNPRPSLLSALLWPRPKAWAALAAIWVLIFALRFASQDKLPNLAQATPSSSQTIAVSLKEQQQVLTEVMETSTATTEMDQPKQFVPRPHSERRKSTATT